jgi:beta-lactamase class A
MEAYLGSLGGRYGVAVIDQDGGALFGTHADELFTAASVIKVPIALFAYHEVEGGRLKLDDQWEMLPEDVSDGTGVLQSEAPGTKFTVARLLDVLIRQSDNTAATMFRRVLTIEKIDAYMADLGAPNSRQIAVTTPRETASLFYQLWRGNVLTPAHRDELLGLLQTTAFNDRIPAGVPSGVPVAHKIGMYGSALNDAGIIFAGRPYILAVFTDTADWDAAAEATRVISAALYEFER